MSHMYRSNFEDVPTMGLAISGGGFASAYTGTAAMRALDDRLDVSVQQRTGGLLQCLTYISGLSGGSFPTVSFAALEFPTAEEIVELWQPSIDRLAAANDSYYAATYKSMFEDIGAKLKAGFPVGTADFFGRYWGYEFTPGDKGGLNITMSGIAELPKFKRHEMPFPIVQAIEMTDQDQTYFGLEVPYPNDTTYDITPYEFGAWGGSVSSFVPTKYLGTRLNNGSAVNESACVEGFDRGSFIMGLSGGAFNFWDIEIESNGTEASFSKSKRTVQAQMNRLRKREEIITPTELDGVLELFNTSFGLNLFQIVYPQVPNPFFGLPSASQYTQTAPYLNMVDGSEGGQTLPLWGQIQPARNPSFIIAWDNDNDAQPYGWNNGTDLHNTYLQANASGIPFPIVPSDLTFVNNHYTHKPVFFGCDKSLTTTGDSRAPIVLYLANAPYSAYMNYSAGVQVMSSQQMKDIFVNGFNQITQGNGTLDKDWPVCLGCAAIERSLEKAGMQTPAQCQRCFERYCWGGTAVDTPVGNVDISLELDPGLSYTEWLSGHEYWNATLSYSESN